MSWTPELQPGILSTDETKMEWLVRSFRKLSIWTSSHLAENEDPHPQYVMEGYGGIFRGTPVTWVGGLSTSWLVIGGYAYDSELSPNPKGVTQDAANGQLTVNETGLWTLSITLTAEITPVTSNAANTVLLTLWDVNAASPGDQPASFVVPRYGEDIYIPFSVPIRITDSDINKPFALAIATKYATPAIIITDLVAIDFHLTRVATEL